MLLYRGSPNPEHQPGAAAANDRQSAHWARQPPVQVIRRPLNYRDWPDQPPREKGIDVALAVDLVHLAIRGDFDVGILFSRDTDLMPALETVRELKAAHVELASWSGTTRLRFPSTDLPWCHFLSEQDYRAVADPRDYTLG